MLQRRAFLKCVGAAGGAAALSAGRAVAAKAAKGAKGAKAAKAAGKPNVVFIITDDQRVDSFGFLHRNRRGKRALTPHIDRLAGQGMYLSRCYATSSVCTPSRFTCLTGMYASRAASTNFRKQITPEGQTVVQWNTDIGPGDQMLARALKAGGYVTGAVGKWHNGAAPGWLATRRNLKPGDDPADAAVARTLGQGQQALHAMVRARGFDYAASINLGNFSAHAVRKLRYHNPEWITKGALDFIEANKARPFYLYMATTLTHGPPAIKSLRADPRITHAGLLDKPPAVQPSRGDVLKRVKAAGLPERLAGATWLDDSIGAVLGKLDSLGLADNTLVIYFNDHGVEGGKGSCYEGGVRTPCLVRWPGRIRPGKSDALVANVDFAPTILAACGINPTKAMVLDGLDIMPVLTGTKPAVRQSVYCEIGYTRAVVTDRWKYLAFRIPPSRQLTKAQRQAICQRYRAMKAKREDKDFAIDPSAPLSHLGFPGGQATERSSALKRYAKPYYDADQLFDLARDPGEQANLAKDPAHKARLGEMQALLREHLAAVPGTFAEFKGK